MTWMGRRRIVVNMPQSVASLARQHGLDRRRFARITLPKADLGIFPVIRYSGREMPIVDMSVGGVCLFDGEDLLSQQLSQDIEIALIWPTRVDLVKSKIVGVSRHNHRHLQFLDLPEVSYNEIETLVRIGSRGQKIAQVLTLKRGPVRLEVEELWTGYQGDGLVFYDEQDSYCELTLFNRTYVFSRSQPHLVVEDAETGREASVQEIADAVICLANVNQPTLRILTLLSDLVIRPSLPLKSTGSSP